MRIRKCASRLLGSAYPLAPHGPAPRFDELPLPPPPPPPPARLTPASTVSRARSEDLAAATASGEICELSRSPWDVISELDLSDPQAEKNLVESYFVHVTGRTSWLFPTSMPATSVKEEELAEDDSAQPRDELAKKPIPKKTLVKKKEGKESKPKKKAKVKREVRDGNAAGVPQIWTCKKNGGKRWSCPRQVNMPNSLCKYHFDQKRMYYSLFLKGISTAAPAATSSAAFKPSTSSKACRKKSADASEGFYYYAGFGPFRTKRHCRSNNMQESAPAEQEEAPPRDSMHESARAEQEVEAPPEDSMHEFARAEQEEEAPPENSMHEFAPSENENEGSPQDITHESAPAEQEEEAPPEHHAAPTGGQARTHGTGNQAATHHDKSCCHEIAGIAGSDEESSSDDTYGCNGCSKPGIVGVNGESKRKSGWKKRWRKPVKARSLKSLM